MNQRFFHSTAFGLAVFFILAFFAGHAGVLSAPLTVGLLAVSLFLSFVLLRAKPALSPAPVPWTLLAILALFGVLLFSAMPDGVFKNTCSDVYNHARAIRLGTHNGTLFTNPLDFDPSLSPLLPAHEYPVFWMGAFIALNTVFGSTYAVIFLFSALLLVLTVAGLYFFARAFADETTALLATLIGGFCIVSFFLLQHGFIPQIAGTAFAIWAVVFFERRERLPAGLLAAASFAYPPNFLALGLYFVARLLLDWKNRFANTWSARDWTVFAALAIAPVLIEIIELGLGRLPHFVSTGGLELIRGGVAVPHPVLLLPFLFALPALVHFAKQKQWDHPLLLFSGALAIGILYVAGGFVLNHLVRVRPPQIHQLYMAVKFLYFLLLPLAVLAAIGIRRLLEQFPRSTILKSIVALVLVAHVLLFAGFLSALPRETENFPPALYRLSDHLSEQPGPFTIGIDPSLLQNTHATPIPYAPFIDNPDAGSGKCPVVELNRLWQFPWTESRLDWDQNYFRVWNPDANQLVIQYGLFDTNYYVTEQTLDHPLVMQDAGIRVYRLN